jgi:hypothetical protein
MRARRHVLVTMALLAVGAAMAAAGTATAGDSAGKTYREYASIREKLLSCSLDRTWNHLGPVDRKRCPVLRRLYVLWSDPNYSGTSYHVHCRTRKKCPTAPEGEPDPRAAIPSGSNVFR